MGLFDWVNDVEDWTSDVWHGNTGDQAVPAPQLVRKVLASKGAVEWHQGATSLDNYAAQLAPRLEHALGTVESPDEQAATDVKNVKSGEEKGFA